MADIKTTVDLSFGYDCGPLALIDEDTLVHACGNGLKLSAMRSVGEGFVWNQHLASNGIASYAVNVKASLIAVAEQSAQPSVTVYRHPDLEVQAEFTDGAEFEFSAIAFSRSGTRLVGISGRTDYNVNVWDLATRARVAGVQGTAPKRVTSVVFNPRDDSQFCGVANGGIYFWKVEKRFDDFRLKLVTGDASAQGSPARPSVAVGPFGDAAAGASSSSSAAGAGAAAGAAGVEAPIQKALRLLDDDSATGANNWLCAAWSTDGHVIAANAAGTVVKFNVETGAAVLTRQFSAAARVQAVVVARSYVVVGCADGQVRWLKPSDLSQHKAVTLVADGTPAAERPARADLAVVHMTPSPSYERLCAGTRGGALYLLTLDKEEDEELAAAGAATMLGSLAERPSEADEDAEAAQRVGSFPRGPVSGLAMLPCASENDRLFAACSTDGSLRVYDYVRRSLLASVSFKKAGSDEPAALTALVCRPTVPLLAVGCDAGRLRMAVVQRVHASSARLQVVGDQRLHDGMLTDAAFAPTQPLLATVGVDGLLYIVDATCPTDANAPANLRFAPRAFARLPAGAGGAAPEPRRVAWRGDGEVLVGLQDGRLLSIVVPAFDASTAGAATGKAPRPVDLSSSLRVRAVTPAVTAILINAPSRCVAEVTGTPTGALITSLASKDVALYDLDWPAGDPYGPALAATASADDSLTEPLGTLPLHAKSVMCAAAAPHGETFGDGVVVLATGAADGSICITIMREGTVTGSSVVRLHARGVVRVEFSPDGMYVLSAGLDGAIFVVRLFSVELHPVPCLTVRGASKAELEQFLLLGGASGTGAAAGAGGAAGAGASSASASASASAASSSMTRASGEHRAFMAKLKALQAEETAALNEAAKGTFRKDLAMLSVRLKDLLQRNEKVPELEKLDRAEFVVDLIGQQAVQAKNAERAAAVRAALERQKLDNEVVARRIKEECWDSMRVQGQALHAFASGLVVHNFPIRRKTAKEKRQLEKMLLLRRIELREVLDAGGGARRAWPGLLDEVPEAVTWIMNAGTLEPVVDPCLLRDKEGDGKKGKKGGKGSEGKGGDAGDEGDDDGDGVDDDGEEYKGEGGAGGAAAVDVSSLSMLELLYHPATARSPNQKRVQVALLKELVRQVEEKFNEKFLAMLSHKEGEVDKINGKNARIEEILAELKDVAADHFVPTWHPDEQPERVLEVEQSEIGFEKYVTEAEKAQRAAEEAARAAAAAQNKDDAPERALQDMMGGTLEAQDDLALLESELQRQPWMDELSEEEMTEAQRIELAEFEAKAKAVLEEKAKMRKALELELKKLKTEVKDIVSHFDAKLKGLYDAYLQTVVYKYSQELYMSRLAIAVQEREDASIREEQLLTKLDELCDVRDAAVASHEAFMNKFDDFRRGVESMLAEDRQMEKNFRSNLMSVSGSIDQDTYKTLHSLFKQRNSATTASGGRTSVHGMSTTNLRRPSLRGSRQRMTGMSTNSLMPGGGAGGKKGGAGGVGGGAGGAGAGAGGESKSGGLGGGSGSKSGPLAVMDPFVDADVAEGPSEAAKKAAAREAALRPLTLEGDCPDGFDVDEPTWNRLQELRNAKIEMELNLAEQQAELAVMEAHLRRLGSELDTADEAIGEVEGDRETLLEQRAVSGSNLELLVKLKQGQDEMDAEAVVTDYSDALLLHRNVVQSINAKIVELGTEKVATLTRIKDFRKDINKLLWMHKLLDAKVHDAEEHYTDLHMLRVTKTLQMFIKGGDIGERQRRNLEKADAKLEHMKKAHARAIAKHRKAAGRVARQARDRRKENSRLAEQCKELEAAVAVRESIHRSRVQAKGGSTDPRALAQARMKAITTRRKLIDLARTQTEEIEFLRQELDRLRQSTFPSFAHASHLAQGNVDEYM